jgi:hypothetical protein
VKARVALRFANFTTDQAIRSCARAAEIADGGRRGPIFNALFPKGVGPVVAPMGARQIKPTEQLVDRMSKSKHTAVIPFAAEWIPKLQAPLATLTAAAAAHKSARATHDDAFREEVSLRDEHRRSVDRLMGETRAAFPGDRSRQDLVFPAVDEGSTPANQDDADAPAGDADPPQVPGNPA